MQIVEFERRKSLNMRLQAMVLPDHSSWHDLRPFSHHAHHLQRRSSRTETPKAQKHGAVNIAGLVAISNSNLHLLIGSRWQLESANQSFGVSNKTCTEPAGIANALVAVPGRNASSGTTVHGLYRHRIIIAKKSNVGTPVEESENIRKLIVKGEKYSPDPNTNAMSMSTAFFTLISKQVQRRQQFPHHRRSNQYLAAPSSIRHR
jgi:hypothetical protein